MSEIELETKASIKGKAEVLQQQIGGTHYKGLAIEPVEYGQKNQLNPCEYSVVKYVSRHKQKGGAEDIKKAIHFALMLLEMEYGVVGTVQYSSKEQ